VLKVFSVMTSQNLRSRACRREDFFLQNSLSFNLIAWFFFGAFFAESVFPDGICDLSLTNLIELILFPLDFFLSPDRF
jgi:hypothetical protein